MSNPPRPENTVTRNEAVQIELGIAFVRALQGDYEAIDVIAKSTPIEFRNGVPFANLSLEALTSPASPSPWRSIEEKKEEIMLNSQVEHGAGVQPADATKPPPCSEMVAVLREAIAEAFEAGHYAWPTTAVPTLKERSAAYVREHAGDIIAKLASTVEPR